MRHDPYRVHDPIHDLAAQSQPPWAQSLFSSCWLSRQSQHSNQHWQSAHLCTSVSPLPGFSSSNARNKLIIKIIILILQKGQQTQHDAPFFLC